MAIGKQSAMMDHTLLELSRRNGHRSQRKPTVLALITTHLLGLESGLSYLRRLNDEEVIIRFSAEEEVLTQFPISNLIKTIGNDDWIPHHSLSERILNQVDIIFIPILSFSIVSDILSFNEQRPFVRLILKALLTGKKVLALKAGADPYHPLWRINGLDKSTTGLKRSLNKQMLQLKSFGIILIEESEQVPVHLDNKRKNTIITEATIQSIYQLNQSQLIISNETIITPLARDKAKELNIELIFE